MLDWIIENKEWFFSGVGVKIVGAVLTALSVLAGWLFWKRSKDDERKSEATGTTVYSVDQTHNGIGDNVAGNKTSKG